jgi:hypothetical protein
MPLPVAVVQASKAYARRHLTRPEPTSDIHWEGSS